MHKKVKAGHKLKVRTTGNLLGVVLSLACSGLSPDICWWKIHVEHIYLLVFNQFAHAELSVHSAIQTGVKLRQLFRSQRIEQTATKQRAYRRHQEEDIKGEAASEGRK